MTHSRRDFVKTSALAATGAALFAGTPSVVQGMLRDAGEPITPAADGLTPQRLRCEYLSNPLGIGETQPRLSWILTSPKKGARQTAYQIIASFSKPELSKNRGNLWDTGKVTTSDTTHIAYTGAPLNSTQRIWWKVRAWDESGKMSQWSSPAWWEMGLLSSNDWHGRWIARNTDTNMQPVPLLRRPFSLKGKVKRARAYITGVGYYELYVNGKRIGDHLLDPGYTRYDKRVLYSTYDVTDAVNTGDNAIGVMLGNGWYNIQIGALHMFGKAPWQASPRMLIDLRVEFVDGRTEIISSDGQWKTSLGPITYNSTYGGETYDARLEQPGWHTAQFDDSNWQAAQIVDSPKGKLDAQAMHPIKSTRVIKPVSVTQPKPGIYLFDVGQNLAGFAEITLSGRAGTEVKLKYAEVLNPDGTASQKNSAGNFHNPQKGGDPNRRFQTDSYILKGTGTERWCSRFVYHGFRYVEVTGVVGPLSTDNIRVHFVHSAVPEAGRFECSNQLFNRIWENTRWSYLSNLHSIPTDCPQRGKNGWTGDGHLAAELGLLTHDGITIYEKWVNDISDEQQPDGHLPGIVPTSGWGYDWGNGPAWDSAFLLIPYYLHLYYGDSRPLERHYEGHKRYIDYLTTKAKDKIVSIGLGDWAPWKTKTPNALTSTAYYYIDALIIADTARMLGKREDEEKYRNLAARIRTAFNERFYDPATAQYANGSQTALSCPLYQGLVQPSERTRVIANLIGAVKSADDHIDTGVLGAKYLLNVLTEGGHAEMAYKIVNQQTIPGWGFWIKQGSTTLWENWDGLVTHQNGSLNHIMFGNVSAWFAKALAGINPDPASPGFRNVIIKPNPVADLTYAKADYDSIRGRITSEWTKRNGIFNLTISIPTNTTATVVLPDGVTERVASGTHKFSVKL